ncbi:hypothetical protein AAZX31_09G118000 [Glycine max]
MKPKYTLLFVFLSDYMNTLSLKLDPPSIRFTSIPSCRIHLRWRMTFFSSIRQMLVTVAPPQQQPRTRLPWRISAAIALNGAGRLIVNLILVLIFIIDSGLFRFFDFFFIIPTFIIPL